VFVAVFTHMLSNDISYIFILIYFILIIHLLVLVQFNLYIRLEISKNKDLILNFVFPWDLVRGKLKNEGSINIY
jgi:hypothetical protein